MIDLTIFSEIFRVLCVCMVMERGSWTPKQVVQRKNVKTEQKPEWLKEWTISKGWIHNRSHLLSLGKKEDEDSSSVSTGDIEELVSMETGEDQDLSFVYNQVSENYRENFPENGNRYSNDLQLPEIYKERLLLGRDQERNRLVQLWKLIKPKRKTKMADCKFTINELYEPLEPKPLKSRTNLGKNLTLLNTLNAKTNLHEETIYECSEENLSIYNNPIYSPLARYYDFQSNKSYTPAFRYQQRTAKTEKYIIRHIKVRIMLSLRIGNFKKRHKRTRDEPDTRRIHDEQRRIGNGRTSIKIQNMRYGRLNVLRWLLWEAEFRESNKMPALERSSNNTTLALHYAAARGCLDCVRLLVDSTPDLSANTQMDNDVTPVYLAAQEGHLDVLKFLVLEAGGSLYVRAKDGMAPIHAASQMGCLNCVKWMIQEQGVDPNLRDGDGATPLHFAASRGHLETVRWLLKHGARLSLDKYGKSPINDAAENQQVECLNVLVQHGTTPDYKEGERPTKPCSCTRKGDQLKRGNSLNNGECTTCKPAQNSDDTSEPFYLHPPLGTRSVEAPHAPQDGLYINPMNTHRHSASSVSESSSNDSVNGESFYLHNPQEVIYNRVKDLFEAAPTRQPLSALTVKVEVHSSSSGAGSDENLSSSDLSERSADHDHDYEDIYLVREESADKKTEKQANIRSRSRDSGSHSRSGSASSSNSTNNVVVAKLLPKPQKYEKTKTRDDDTGDKTKLGLRHSMPPKTGNGTKQLKRMTSVPGDAYPPPPPPPPPADKKEAFGTMEDEPRGAEVVEIVEEPTLKPSEIAKGMHRTMSALSTKRLNSSCSDLTIVSLNTDSDDVEKQHAPNLVNKQRVLPFVPPSFPGSGNSNNLIKPSEYLKSISDKRSSTSSVRSNSESEEIVMSVEDKDLEQTQGPPPPPLPELAAGIKVDTCSDKKLQQPLGAISIQDLNSVQLRRTDKMIASKTFSAPTRSVSLQCLQSEPFLAQKTDLIAELKMSRDIPGIKKLKIERAKVEESKEKEMYTEITKQFTTTKFVEKIPDKDNTGNIIPAWKRQMLAKKAAERARKELEEQMLREAEEKRLQAIPQWKRQLMQKKEETEIRIRSTIYTPKIVDDPRALKLHDIPPDENNSEDLNNNHVNGSEKEECGDAQTEEEEADEDVNIIPWRAQLRKTNSKLNLLD